MRFRLPAEAGRNAIRCVIKGQAEHLAHWVQTVEMTDPVRLAKSPEVHYGFPRMVRTANSDLLLFYRVGTMHARDRSSIVLTRSCDDGKTWSRQRILRTDAPGFSAHNPVPFVTARGRVILWASRFQFSTMPPVKGPGV